MSFLDVLFLAIFAIFALRGLLRGFVKEVLSLAAMVAGFFLASTYNAALAPRLSEYISGEGQALAAAWLIIFIAATILGWILIKALTSFLKVSMLGWLDAVLGAIFGLAEGVLLVLVVTVLLMNFMSGADFVKQSKLMPHTQNWAGLLLSYAPDEARQSLEDNGLRLPPSPAEPLNTDDL
ncbi:MAG: CvpA family protein [Desulfovibrionaceae bacterium]